MATPVLTPKEPQTLAAPTTATTSWAPTAKVSAGVLAASAVTLLMPLLKKWIGTSDPAAAAAALTTVATFVIQYLVPERKTHPTG